MYSAIRHWSNIEIQYFDYLISKCFLHVGEKHLQKTNFPTYTFVSVLCCCGRWIRWRKGAAVVIPSFLDRRRGRVQWRRSRRLDDEESCPQIQHIVSTPNVASSQDPIDHPNPQRRGSLHVTSTAAAASASLGRKRGEKRTCRWLLEPRIRPTTRSEDRSDARRESDPQRQ